jgi:hypothetical protein
MRYTEFSVNTGPNHPAVFGLNCPQSGVFPSGYEDKGSLWAVFKAPAADCMRMMIMQALPGQSSKCPEVPSKAAGMCDFMALQQ